MTKTGSSLKRTADVVKRQRLFDENAQTLPTGAAIAMDIPQNPANGVEVRNLSKRFRVSTEGMGRMSSFLRRNARDSRRQR